MNNNKNLLLLSVAFVSFVAGVLISSPYFNMSPFKLFGVLSAETVPTPSVEPTASPTPTGSVTPTITPTVTPSPTPIPLTVTLTVNNGAPTFVDPVLNLNIAPSLDPSKISAMHFSQDGGATWSNWEAFSSTKSLRLPADAVWGDRNVRVEIKDLNNNLAQDSKTATYVSANKASMKFKTSYNFATNVSYAAGTITTTQTLSLTNNSGDFVSTLNFSVLPKAFGEFSLGKVLVDGKEVLPSWSNNSNLVVNLNKNLRDGDSSTIVINFVDTPSSNTSTYLDTLLSNAKGIIQIGNWFPILSDGHAMRMPGDSQYTLVSDKFHMDLTLDGDYKVAAPGTLKKVTTKTRSVDFGPGRNFAFEVCPTCVDKSGTTNNGTTVRVVYLPGAPGATALTYAISSLNLFNSKFAVKYPYDTYTVAQSTGKPANEFPGLIYIHASLMDEKSIVQHETAHQWFYGILGNDQMNAPWLDEAFAEWAGRDFNKRTYCSSRAVSSSIYDFPDVYDFTTDQNCGSYDQTIYRKGSNLIEGVRGIMGETAFWKSMDNLLTQNKFGVISAATVANNWLNYTPTGTKKSLTTLMQKYITW